MLTNPTQLSLGKLYTQASRQARVKREDDGLPVRIARWHIQLNGASVKSHIQRLATNEWLPGPGLSPGAMADEGELGAALRQAAQIAQTTPQYLEVVVHVANEFLYNQQRSDLPNHILNNAKVRRALLHTDPASMMADDIKSYLTSDTWMDAPGLSDGRIALRLPCNRWTALRRAYESACKSGLYRLTVTHAALEALAVSGKLALGTGAKPFLHFIYFSNFAMISGITASGTVTLLRRVEMPGGEPSRDIGRHLDDAVVASGLSHAGLALVPMSDLPPKRVLEKIIESHGNQEPLYDKNTMVNLSTTVLTSSFKQMGATGVIEDLRAEHLFWTESFWNSVESLRESCEGSFYFRTSDENEALLPLGLGIYPFVINALRPFVIAGAIAVVLWCVATFLQAATDPDWRIKLKDKTDSETALQSKRLELDRTAQNKGRMTPRGTTALTVILTSTLFPEGSGVTLEKASFDLNPILAADLGKRQQLGLSLVWTYRGRASAEGLKKIETITADSGLALRAMRQAATALGMPSLAPETNGELKLSSNIQRGVSSQGDTLFELRIERLIDSVSPLALPVAKKEKL